MVFPKEGKGRHPLREKPKNHPKLDPHENMMKIL
jgi:hypothetical protein